MEIKCKPASFDILFSERVDIENESEHYLPDYMPGIQRIIKSDVAVKLSDKKCEGNTLEFTGDIVYSVLYISENSGLVKRFVFSEPFEKICETKILNNDVEDGRIELFVKVLPVMSSVKLSGQRGFAARSKHSFLCEAFVVTDNDSCKEEVQLDCEVEFLRKQHQVSAMVRSEDIRIEFSEEIIIDSDMPEISDIVFVDSYCCVKNISQSDGVVDVSGEITLNILYEAQNNENSDYISFQKSVPFRTEAELDCIESSWSVFAELDIKSLSTDITSDSSGENRIIVLDAECVLNIVAFKNHECVVYTDMYSTGCCVVPEINNMRTYTLIDAHKSSLTHEERLRTDIKGIADIVTSTLKLNFSNPEFSETGFYMSCRGNLCILGIKENGEIEAQNIPVALKIPAGIQNHSAYSGKTRWFNFTSLCRHECELIGGEPVLKLCINRSYAVFAEENMSVINGYEKCDSSLPEKACGFTMYYPDAGESIWSVAKEHFVSFERVKAENGISGDTFDGNSPVILH